MRKNLVKARKRLKLTHYQIAMKAKISRCYYTMIENGTRTPSIRVALRLSTILNDSIENLFKDM